MFLNNRLFLEKNKKRKKNSKLEANPFLKGLVTRATVVTPKKPNSARRPVAKIAFSNKFLSLCHIPGIGHNLRKHSLVLVRGGGARDLPMVSYSCIRGKYDLIGVANRITRRSIYGVKLNKEANFLKKKFKRI